MPFLTCVLISMSASDMNNGINGTGIFDEGASPGRLACWGTAASTQSLSCNCCSREWTEIGKEEMVSRGEQGFDGMLF